VGYYGVGIENALDESANLHGHLMLHIAAQDAYCSAEAQAKIHAVLDGDARVTIHDYAGQDHAFARVGGAHFNAAAAAQANQRSLAFFAEHLNG
jgi:carboxymethylenebutenolidase